MKKLFNKLFEKFLNKAVKKAVSNNNAEAPKIEPAVPGAEPADDSKKALWKFILHTFISILTAILTSLGYSSCVNHF